MKSRIFKRNGSWWVTTPTPYSPERLYWSPTFAVAYFIGTGLIWNENAA